jgi:hypothetical protein
VQERGTATAALIVAACAGVLLAGCADGPSGQAGNRPPATGPGTSAGGSSAPPPATSTPPIPPTPSASSTHAPADGITLIPESSRQAGDTLVVYRRSGGIAGARDEVVVRKDGRLTRITRFEQCDFRLNPRQLAELRADLDRANFPTLRGPSRPTNVADAFSYVVVYQGRTVRMYDLAIPERVQPAMSRLARLALQPCLR